MSNNWQVRFSGFLLILVPEKKYKNIINLQRKELSYFQHAKKNISLILCMQPEILDKFIFLICKIVRTFIHLFLSLSSSSLLVFTNGK